jgi:ubiquinone biosynthesis protein COQ4
VREALNIPEPTKYRECHRIWREEGLDPYDLLASGKDAGEPIAA